MTVRSQEGNRLGMENSYRGTTRQALKYQELRDYHENERTILNFALTVSKDYGTGILAIAGNLINEALQKGPKNVHIAVGGAIVLLSEKANNLTVEYLEEHIKQLDKVIRAYEDKVYNKLARTDYEWEQRGEPAPSYRIINCATDRVCRHAEVCIQGEFGRPCGSEWICYDKITSCY